MSCCNGKMRYITSRTVVVIGGGGVLLAIILLHSWQVVKVTDVHIN